MCVSVHNLCRLPSEGARERLWRKCVCASVYTDFRSSHKLFAFYAFAAHARKSPGRVSQRAERKTECVRERESGFYGHMHTPSKTHPNSTYKVSGVIYIFYTCFRRGATVVNGIHSGSGFCATGANTHTHTHTGANQCTTHTHTQLLHCPEDNDVDDDNPTAQLIVIL